MVPPPVTVQVSERSSPAISSPSLLPLTDTNGGTVYAHTNIQMCTHESKHHFLRPVVMFMLWDSKDPLTLHVYLVLLCSAVMVRFSTNSCTDVPSLTTLLDSSNHWMDSTGTGVEHVTPDVSPRRKILFPVIALAAIKKDELRLECHWLTLIKIIEQSQVQIPDYIISLIRYCTHVYSDWLHSTASFIQNDWTVTPAPVNDSSRTYFITIWKSPCTTFLSSCCRGAASCSISQTEQSTTALSYVTKQHYAVARENSTIEEETNTCRVTMTSLVIQKILTWRHSSKFSSISRLSSFLCSHWKGVAGAR